MNGSGHAARRALLGIVLPVVVIVVALLPLWLFRGRLPQPLATHWNLHGQPNGAMPVMGLVILVTVLAGTAAAGMSVFAWRRNAGRREISVALAAAGFLGGQIAAVNWLTVLANLDAPGWRQAGHLHLPGVLLTVLAGGALAAILAWLGRGLENTAPAITGGMPSAGLAPGARAVWVGRARAGWVLWAVTIGSFALAILTSFRAPVAGVIPCIVGLACLVFTSIRVIADRAGVRIAYGPFGWPVQRVQLADIRQATMLHVEPMAWGGWGHRGSLKIMKRAAIVVRAGEGLRLELTGERTLVITVDGAEQGAGLINDLLAAGR
ncbi:MAG TPA: DUF1648 domain-containing protein [Steroidobacteraceae bacterium]|nr:DUF1648 domain-containing protein [Steroidobacteraceae bacterium]